MTDIATFFKVDPVSLQKFFSPSNLGYYIPLYQREYSWDDSNIDQLMADLCYGVEASLNNAKALHFMGTVILTESKESDPDQQRLDPRAIPEEMRKVIDGQQRISTIALLACLSYQQLYQLKQGLPTGAEYVDLIDAISAWQRDLLEFFSFDLKRGKPSRKPIVIRGAQDKWAETDQGQSTYKSDVSAFLASFIRAIEANPPEPAFPSIPDGEPVGRNLRKMNTWIDRIVNAHKIGDDGDFPPAWQIIGNNLTQQQLWQYQRPQITSQITNRGTALTETQSQLCSIVQMLACCHYLLKRCGFTVIVPANDEGAFDMFQSLNATGTPLTALETFKPLVVNSAENMGGGYFNSTSEGHFEHIDNLFKSATKAADKNTLTNEYLTAFALMHDGTKLPSQFSVQRMWLTQRYDTCETMPKREEFVRRMGNLAVYWEQVVRADLKKLNLLPGTENVAPETDTQEAVLCIAYLRDSRHTMAHTVLGRFYSQVLRQKSGADVDFVAACRAVGAFYTLWRAALTNRDLDDAYRKLLREQMSWEKGDTHLTITELKQYFRNELDKKSIGTKDQWKQRARLELRYDTAKLICKFALLVAAHDTIPDNRVPGLVQIGVAKSCPHLTARHWQSKDLSSIEHVAPQTRDPGGTWDNEIYLTGNQQRIGNLILLPTTVNEAAGNKPWIAKWIYYRHLAENDPAQLQALTNLAGRYNVQLTTKTLKKLQDAGYHNHISSIVDMGENAQWNRAFIEQRTDRICDILWDRIHPWLM